MSDVDRTACLAEFPLLNPAVQRLCDEFEAAWMQAIASGPRPQLKTYLERGPSAERAALQRALAQIEHRYQQLLSAAAANPGEVTNVVRVGTRGTLDARACTDAAIGAGAAMDFGATIDPAPCSDVNATLDPAPVADPSATIDPTGSAETSTTAVADPPVPGGRTTAAPHASGAESATLDLPPETSPNQTIDFDRSAKTAGAASPDFVLGGATLDHAPEASPTQTVDLGSSAKGTDVDSTDFTFGEPENAEADAADLIAGHEILGELGRGGMGVVYKARQVKLNRTVALKMVLAGAHAGTEQLARFQIEAEAVARLHHPNIVQIYEVGEHEGLPFFSLEYADGGSLAAKIGGKPQAPGDAARMVERLADAMDSAHRQNIIHRDLKPANVLLTASGDPKITDFGLAKRLEGDSCQTRSGTLMGTPSYMAPEQARGDTKNIGPLSDVYALGAILYEMLTGRPPIQGTTIVEVLDLVQKQEPVPPRRLQPNVPRDLETICLKCLQKEPAQRYGTAGNLAADLLRFLGGEPIMARPVGPHEKAWRWCRRNPRVAGLSAAVFFLFVTAGAAISVLSINAANESADAAARQAREEQAIEETRGVAVQRLQLATEAIRPGRYRQSQAILQWSDPQVEGNPALSEVRDNLHLLRAQVNLYVQFKEHLDKVRYYALFGPKAHFKEASASCRQLNDLFDEIENKTGRGSCGMPPLDATQEKLLQEEYFETFLVLAQIAWDLASLEEDVAARQAGERKAVALLDRAERIYADAWTLYFRRSNYLEKLGDGKRALADRERMAKMRPTLPLDRFWLAYALHLQGDGLKEKNAAKSVEKYRRAIQEYAALLRLRPDHFWAYFDEALCHLQLGNLDDAVIGFTMCIQIRPEVIWPYYNRGWILVQQKQYAAAVEDLTTVLTDNPANADAVYDRAMAYAGLDKTDLALADFDRLVKLKPNLGAAYFQRAELYRKLKRTQDALTDYDRASELDVKNPAIHTSRGLLYLALSDFSKARDDFARAIELRPNEPNDYRLHGLVSLRMYDFSAAHGDWNALGKLLPKNPEALQNNAITFKAEGRYDEALKALAGAIQLSPGDSKAYLSRAQLYHQMGKLKEAEADHVFVLTKLKDRKAEILNDYGDLLRTMRRHADALSTYEQSIELLSKQTDAYVGIALVRLGEGKPQLAAPIFDKMISANPNSFRTYLRRAEFHRSCGQWDEALKDCEQAARLDPKSALPALVRASVRAGRGEFREAVEDAEHVLLATRADGNLFQAAACVWSLASRTAQQQGDLKFARQCADRAAALVADTMRKGFLDLNYQAYNRLLVDPALAPIHDHPIVLELLPVLRQSSG